MANDEVLKPTFPYKGYVPPQPLAKPEETANIMKEDTVTMYFPSEVLVTLPNHQRVKYTIGVQEVPLSISRMPYVLAHGAKIHDAGAKIKMTASHVKFLNSPEYRRITTVDDAQKYFDGLSKQEQTDFIVAAAKYDSPTLPDTGALNMMALTGGEDSINEKHVKFLQLKGYPAKNVDEAKNFYSNLTPEQRGKWLQEVDAWDGDPKNNPDAVIEDPKTITTKEVDAAKEAEAKKAEDAKAADAAKAEAKKAEDAKLKPAAPAAKK